MELKGKAAFITGGAQGIGRGMAEALLQNGVKVFIADMNTSVGETAAKELAEKFGQENIRFATLDVTDHQNFADVYKQAVSEFGGVDIMVNNAGIVREALWEKTIDINLKAVVHGTLLATEHMRKDQNGRGGRIVNISSLAGLKIFHPAPVYSCTKHAVRVYTAALSRDPNNAGSGVQYAVICPGAVETPLFSGWSEGKKDKASKDTPVVIPLSVSRVAECLLELLRLENMNGCTLHVENDTKQYVTMEYRPVETQPK